MGVDDSLVQEIVRRLLNVILPDRIILFGSAATGIMTRDSDVDLLVEVAFADAPRTFNETAPAQSDMAL